MKLRHVGGVAAGGSDATGGSATGSGGMGSDSLGPAGTTSGGTGLGGMGATAVGGSGGTSMASSEDDGADCAVTGLPEAGSLTANAKLPDPFKKLNGARITSKAEWRCRRQEIRKLAEKERSTTSPARTAPRACWSRGPGA